jgi:hypothetical protein
MFWLSSLPGCEALPQGRSPALLGGEASRTNRDFLEKNRLTDAQYMKLDFRDIRFQSAIVLNRLSLLKKGG